MVHRTSPGDHDMTFFNVSYRKVGGIRFLKIGRLTLSWCVSTAYRPLKAAAR